MPGISSKSSIDISTCSGNPPGGAARTLGGECIGSTLTIGPALHSISVRHFRAALGTKREFNMGSYG